MFQVGVPTISPSYFPKVSPKLPSNSSMLNGPSASGYLSFKKLATSSVLPVLVPKKIPTASREVRERPGEGEGRKAKGVEEEGRVRRRRGVMLEWWRG